jgi:hypothetical protein
MAQEGRDEKGKFLPNNLFCLGGFNGGRPPMYDNPEEMFKKIGEYLQYEDDQKDKVGKGVYTLSGCALFLGFASRESMYEYEKKSSGFTYAINKFRLFMTHWNEQKLYWGGTYMGSQFWLRNHGGYSEDVNQNLKHTITEVKPEVQTGTPKIETE